MIRVADFAATAWEKILQNLDPIESKMKQAAVVASLWTGETQENIQAQLDLATATDNVAYITDLTKEEVKAQADALSQYLMVQDETKSATEAYYEALVYVAEGMDEMGIAQQQMTDAQANGTRRLTAC